MRGSSEVAGARRAMALSGHPGVSWSILAEAAVDALPPPEAVAERLREAIADRPDLGPVPAVGMVAAGGAHAARAEFADRPYAEPGPVLRVALVDGDPPSVLVAAHHGALDGLGLLALLGVALGTPFGSSVRGLGPRRPPLPFLASAALRAAEALVAPPLRVHPAPGSAPGPRSGRARGRERGRPGDHLLATGLPIGRVGTAGAVLAAAEAVRAWNRTRGAAGRGRMVVAVGASRRAGAGLELEERSAYLRIRVGAGDDEEAVRALLAAARPEPAAPAGRAAGVLALPAGLMASALSSRLGSTLLVSNLGSVHGPEGVRSVAFHPVAHGRSGVAVGLATVGDAATVTLRARRSDFGPEAAAALLREVADRLARGRPETPPPRA